MMHVFGSNQKSIGLFQDYNELFKHIRDRENLKLLDGHARFLEDPWSFALHSHKRLSYIYPKTLEKYFSKIGKEACEQELDLLEIYKGDYDNPIQIPVTPDVNVQELREKWCQEYCDTHDYVLVDYDTRFDSHLSMDSMPAANGARDIKNIKQEA